MEQISNILCLLEEKKACFILYDNITQSMLRCPEDELDQLFFQRSKIADQINYIDKKIKDLCLSDDQLNIYILKAVKNSCNRADLPSSTFCIFDLAQDIFLIINRIRNTEEQISQSLLDNQQELISLIKSNQIKPNILKYLESLEPNLTKGSLLSTKNRKA